MSLSTISWTQVGSVSEAGKHALFAGYQSDGSKVYVGKAVDSTGNTVPAKLIPESNACFFEEGGVEKNSDKIEFLFHNEGYSWLKSGNGATVPDAVSVGSTYVGRAEIDGTTVVGKVDPETKQLVASYYGKIVNLDNYDVLVFKPSNKTHFQQMVTKEVRETSFNSRSDSSFSNTFNERLIIRDNSMFSEQKILELQNRIQTLELELSNFKNDRRNYEQRISFEQRRVADLNNKIQSMRTENSVFIRERTTFEERLTSENSKISGLEIKLQDILNENTFLLKKISGLEETLKSERYQMDIYTERFKASLSTGSNGNKNKGFEERVKNLQSRIFELESLIENGGADTDSLRSQLSNYESTIEHQKMQVDSILKKLQGSNADNEFLVKKLSLLTQTLRNYQFEIESMTSQLQNAKAIIASLHAELARANAALSKYQAAIGSAYMINGELMTKVSGFSQMSQFSSSSNSKFDILGLSMSSIDSSSKQLTYNTSALLEATGSETYLKYIRATSSESTESGNVAFQPLGPEPINNAGFTPFTAASESA
jgi:predicted  nucleic acid-binding Zn-ribbon protein